jgi:hypothetical protein
MLASAIKFLEATILLVLGSNAAADRVAMQDASAQTALLQFMVADLPRTAVPTTSTPLLSHTLHLSLSHTK